MTPKEIAESILNLEEYDDYLRDVELTYKVPELAQSYLALESRIQKLADALERIANYNNGVLDGIKLWSVIRIAKEALAELGREWIASNVSIGSQTDHIQAANAEGILLILLLTECRSGLLPKKQIGAGILKNGTEN